MIDDSGTGDLLGDAFIVFWRRETNDLLQKHIPLELYQTSEFNIKTRQLVKDLFIDAITELNIPNTEEIYLCTGAIFDESRKYLDDNHYNFKSIKIEGYLQDIAEKTYIDHLIEDLGVPENIIPFESGKKRFFALFQWLSADFPRRIKNVKSGFEKWQSKWQNIAYEEWMRKMVSTNEIPKYNSSPKDLEDQNPMGLSQDEINENSQKTNKTYHPKPRNNFRPYHGPSKKSSRSPRIQKNIKTSKKSKPFPKRSLKKSSNSSNHHKDDGPKYSSTNPDPRKKFF
jgi:hypothetical protein